MENASTIANQLTAAETPGITNGSQTTTTFEQTATPIDFSTTFKVEDRSSEQSLNTASEQSNYFFNNKQDNYEQRVKFEQLLTQLTVYNTCLIPASKEKNRYLRQNLQNLCHKKLRTWILSQECQICNKSESDLNVMINELADYFKSALKTTN